MSEQNLKAFELKVKPDEYGDLNKPLPDTVPKPNVGCGIRNDECFGLIFAWIVAPEEAMDYDSVEDTVKDVRLSLMENMGLLECKNGLTAKGTSTFTLSGKFRRQCRACRNRRYRIS